MAPHVSRRVFLATGASAGIAAGAPAKPAVLGGPKVHTTGWPKWPYFDKTEEEAMLATLRSAQWFRGYGKQVQKFEEAYAAATGAKGCLATANGTSALLTSLAALGVGPGDEVIVPPYTFIATINAVLAFHAVPVFVDSDRESMQIDARKIEAAITPRTKVIMPVHLGGSPADLDAILAVAAKRKIPVVEDACQSHFGEWRNRKVGSWGATGCFSFQASKNLNSGEGGAMLTNDEKLLEAGYAFHNNSRGRKSGGYDFTYSVRGLNLRMTEFQATLLVAQMTRLDAQMKVREQNAAYLAGMLKEIPGLKPAKVYAGCTRNAYHLFMFRYDKEQFAGLPRAKFLRAMGAEGIPGSAGYQPLNKEPFLKNTMAAPGYQRLYGKDFPAQWVTRNQCPENDLLCEEGIFLTQNMLLGSRSDMEQIAEAARKIQSHAPALTQQS